MVSKFLECPTCGSEKISKNGKSPRGTQKYICKNTNCTKRYFILDYVNKRWLAEVKDQIVQMSINGSGIRDTARVLKISINTVSSTLKKSEPNQ